MIYELLAPFYDKVNGDIDYKSWADFIDKIIERHYNLGKPELILDLGSGTGRMTLELASRGYDMTGVDYSPEMLNVARESEEKLALPNPVLWLCQDIREFELYGTVDVAVSCLDTINHLTDRGDVETCFSLVHNYLIPDGLFIFDLNSKYKFENVYSDNSYVMEEDGKVCIWQNYYNRKNGICDFYITLFEEGNDGKYTRYDDVQREKMYGLKSVKNMLGKTGFEFLGAYTDFDFGENFETNDRTYIVARCKKA